MTADRDVARVDATRLSAERDAARAKVTTSAHALQTAQSEAAVSPQALRTARYEVVELRARAPTPGGSSSQPGSSATAAQLAAERRTVQRLRASVVGSSVLVDTLLNRAELQVVEIEGKL